MVQGAPTARAASKASRSARLATVLLVLGLLGAALLQSQLAVPVPDFARPAPGSPRDLVVRDLKEKMPEQYQRLSEQYGPNFEALAPVLDAIRVSESDFAQALGAKLAGSLERRDPMTPPSMPTDLAKWALDYVMNPGPAAAAPAAAAAAGGGAPSNTYQDFWPACDLNGDGREDMIDNSFEFYFRNFWELGEVSQKESNLYALSADNGTVLWKKPLLGYMPFVPFNPLTGDSDGSDVYYAPTRPGMPNPNYDLAPADVFRPATDLNGNGVCDFLGFGYVMKTPLTPFAILLGVLWFQFQGELAAIEGSTGASIWVRKIDSDVKSVFPPPIPCGFVGRPPCPNYEVYILLDYPTGWWYAESSTGPKLVWKTTDVSFNRQQDNQERVVREKIALIDARKGTDYWVREIVNPDTGVVRMTWVSGMGDLIGSDERDIVLEDATLFAPGNAIALLGELDRNGQTLWTSGFYVPPNNGQAVAEFEGATEVYLWQYVRVIDDVTNDKWDEVIASYLNGPPSGKFPLNEDYKTHFHPLSGTTGAKLWPGKDIKFQGWGFMEDLNPVQNESKGYIGLGTVDVPTPKLPGTKFLPKYSRIATVNSTTGEPRYIYRERYGLDSYFSYDLAIKQFFYNIAPKDVNGDGLRDPVTPARYRAPQGAAQVLTANVQHDIFVLDGFRGKPLQMLTPWGPNGQVIVCNNEGRKELTVVSGHSKRFDLTRFDAQTASVTWRQAMHNDPTPQSPIAGQELLFLSGRCADTHDNRTQMGFSAGMISLRRGFEIRAPHGYLLANETLDWLQPPLVGKAPMNASIDYLFRPAAPLSLNAKIGIAAAPVVPSFAVGLGLSFLRFRRKGGIV